MVRRGLLLAVTAALAFTGVWAQALAGPPLARACTCGPTEGLAELARQPGVVILTGTIGVQQADRIPIAVEAWYHGNGVAPVVWLSVDDVPGGVASHDCGRPSLHAGERQFIVAAGPPSGPFAQRACTPSGTLETAAGQALVADAAEVFGAPLQPSSPDPNTTDPPTAPTVGPPIDAVAWPYAVGLIGAAAVIFVVVTFFALRRRPGG